MGFGLKLGSTIYSENNSNQHYCGEAIDLDDDGYRLAVSSSGNNQVRIFDYDGIDWNSTILPIMQAGGLLGNSGLDLTPDGNTIAICGKENPTDMFKVQF